MGRTAEYSIKGYLYQFLRYLSELLAATDGQTVTIEGAIEDIDISSASRVRAVQCKYHEQADTFSLSRIYKPILLMMEHFSHNPNVTPLISYHLFCHFPNSTGRHVLKVADLEKILATTAVSLKPIVGRIKKPIDLAKFLERLTIEFGPTVDDLQEVVLLALQQAGFSIDDTRAVIYPAALQRIVETSVKDTTSNRSLTREPFIAELRKIKHVTFTRWTRELLTRKQIFQRLRKDLKASLDQNGRRRFFIIDPTEIVDFDDAIVNFIKAFVEKFSFKYLHTDPPLFAIAGNLDIQPIIVRLYEKQIEATTGLVGSSEFRRDRLFRQPMITRKKSGPARLEFRLRLVSFSNLTSIADLKPDEIFLVNMAGLPWNVSDANVHQFDVERLSDLEYVLQLRASI